MSSDLLHWEFVAQPTLSPNAKDSLKGVLTGCMVPYDRDDRAQMFICGDLEKTNNGLLSMKFKYGGLLDRGAFYAGNSFWDPVTNTHILWGWIQAGVLSFPRALRLITVDCVESALFSVKYVIQSLITVYFTSLSYDTQCECSQLHHFIDSIAHEIDLEAVATM